MAKNLGRDGVSSQLDDQQDERAARERAYQSVDDTVAKEFESKSSNEDA